MKCPNCGRKMLSDHTHTFCIHCGYMENGTFIKKKEDSYVSDVEIYLGNEYEVIYYNNNNYLTLLLGPFYFCYRNYFWLGILGFIFNLFCYFLTYCTFPKFFFLTFLLLRILYMTAANILYLKLLEKKVETIGEPVVA